MVPLLIIDLCLTEPYRYYEQPTANGKKVTGADSILPTEVKNFFLSRFFICYEYNELSQSTEEEMFQLVQRGIALTPAEKMRAMSTEWAEFTRQYEEDYSMIINRQYFELFLLHFTDSKDSFKARARFRLSAHFDNFRDGPGGYVEQKKE
jgi:hypothetical protein